MPARRRSSRRWLASARPWLTDLALLVFIAVGVFLGPRVVDARTALHWTRYYAAQPAVLPRPVDASRQAGRAAARALDLVAPLPMAAEAAENALAFGRRMLQAHPPAALPLFAEVRGALDRARASRWRGAGLGALAEEARRLEQEARTAASPPAGKP